MFEPVDPDAETLGRERPETGTGRGALVNPVIFHDECMELPERADSCLPAFGHVPPHCRIPFRDIVR